VACLKVPHLAAQVERRHQPTRPVLVGEQTVIDFSQELTPSGVRRGMPIHRARILCPSARVRPPNVEQYAVENEAVLNALDTFSPLVENSLVGRAYLEVYPENNAQAWGAEIVRTVQERLQLQVSLGLASNKFVSSVASSSFGVGRVLYVTAGIESTFLRPYPLTILPLDADTLRRLHLLGIQKTGVFAALPARAVLNQFGFAGQRAQRFARGEDSRPLQPRKRQGDETVQNGFDPPLEDHTTTLQSFQRLLTRLMTRLQVRGQMCRELRVMAELENRTHLSQQWALREPTNSARHLLLLVERWLTAQEFPERIQHLIVSVGRLECASGKQLDMFQYLARSESPVYATLDRLLKRYGTGRLFQAVLNEQDSFLSHQRFSLVPLRADD
jgi:nucleotidyltransferase/DNA polymerase involved in DNA repair